MQRPIAFKLAPDQEMQVLSIRGEPIDTTKLSSRALGPAIVVARKATILQELTTGLVDADEIIAALDGDWNRALLILVGDEPSSPKDRKSEDNMGDGAFITALSYSAPHLAALGREIVELIRANGVTGELKKKESGRWVNSPLNSFTLKAQPRVGNIQFTIYGEPESYDAGEFLLRDQNSYSRGWVKNSADAAKFAGLAKVAHARRQR